MDLKIKMKAAMFRAPALWTEHQWTHTCRGPHWVRKTSGRQQRGAEGRFPPWRRRKRGGGGEKEVEWEGSAKKSAKYKVQQMVKCSYVSSIKITKKAGNQKVNSIVATWLFDVWGWVRGPATRGRGAAHAAPSDWLSVWDLPPRRQWTATQTPARVTSQVWLKQSFPKNISRL